MDVSANDDVSFDFMKCFPEEVCETIFGHLGAKDLLKASLVSTDWYKLIAKTSVCMRKLSLKLSSKAFLQSPAMKEILVNSSRKYENVETTNYYKENDKIRADIREILQMSGRKWKKVSMTKLKFKDVSELIDFFAIFETTVEELIMDHIDIDCRDNRQQNKLLTFPKLKILSVTNIQPLIFNEALFDILRVNERKWEKVSMSQLYFSEVSDFMGLISIFEPTVEELTLGFIFINNIHDYEQTKSLTFPKLKVLEVRNIRHLIYEEALGNVKTLIELSIELDHKVREDKLIHGSMAVGNIFRNNKNIKRLTITAKSFDEFYAVLISPEVVFKLTSLEMRDIYNQVDNFNENLNYFLLLHLNTLESLHFEDWIGEESAKMIFFMPKLKHLTMKGFSYVEPTLDWKLVVFHKSILLSSLEIRDIKPHADMLKAFISATPKLKSIQLFSANDETLVSLSNLPELESVSVDIFEGLDVTDRNVLPNLKEFSMKVHRDDVKLSNTDEDRGNFEKLFVAKMKEISPILNNGNVPARLPSFSSRYRRLAANVDNRHRFE